jgi:hypothetical protein
MPLPPTPSIPRHFWGNGLQHQRMFDFTFGSTKIDFICAKLNTAS